MCRCKPDTKEALAGCVVLDTASMSFGNHPNALEDPGLDLSVPQFPYLFSMGTNTSFLCVREPHYLDGGVLRSPSKIKILQCF